MYKKAVVTGKGEPLAFVTSEVPVPPPGMVRVKTAFAGVCHSDLHIVGDELGHIKEFGKEKFQGMIIGHEIAGYVDSTGEGVHLDDLGLRQGDPVVVFPWVGCTKCQVCRAGYSNVCPTPGAFKNSQGCSPDVPGGYQTHVMVRPEALLRVPSEVPMDVACMLPCSGGTAFSALTKLKEAVNFGNLRRGNARLLIIGAGGLGLWAVQIAKAMFAGVHVIVADIDESKFNLAKVYGADETVLWDATAEPTQNADAILENGGCDAVVDFCASESTVSSAVKSLGRNGAIVIVGLRGGTLAADLLHVVNDAIDIRGNNTTSIGHLADVMALVEQGQVTYPGCSFYAFEEVNQALDKLRRGEISGRAIIDFNNIYTKMT